MNAQTNPFFLPISRETILSMLVTGQLPRIPAELAALMVISMIYKSRMTIPEIERALYDASVLINNDPEGGCAHVLDVWSTSPVPNINEMEDFLAQRAIMLTPQEEIGAALKNIYDSDYQNRIKKVFFDAEIPIQPMDYEPDALADDDDPAKPVKNYRLTGTRDQNVAAQTIARLPDEHIELEAFAGTGKTFLISALMDAGGRNYTYVAPSWVHTYRFTDFSNSNSKIRTITLPQLVMATLHEWSRTNRMFVPRRRPAQLDPTKRAKIAGIGPIGMLTAEQAVNICERAINSFCDSDAAEIDAHHFTHNYRFSFAEIKALVDAARRIFQLMFERSTPDYTFSIRTGHLVKWMELNQITIPTHYGTLLVDEAHDLYPSWRRLLLSYNGGVVLMGDRHQRLRGTPKNNDGSKILTMTQSLRSGLTGEKIINRTLSISSNQRAEFRGARDHITKINYSEQNGVTTRDGLNIYSSEWSVLSDAQFLSKSGARFHILPATFNMIKQRVHEVLELRRRQSNDWQALAGGFHYWEDFADHLLSTGHHRVVRLFDRGYSAWDLQAMDASQAPPAQATITLALTEHVKNLESDSINVNGSCFSFDQLRLGYNPANAIYLALTRARNEIWMPGDGMDRLVDLQAASGQPV